MQVVSFALINRVRGHVDGDVQVASLSSLAFIKGAVCMENKLPSKNKPKNIPIKIIFKIVALIFCKGTSTERRPNQA